MTTRKKQARPKIEELPREGTELTQEESAAVQGGVENHTVHLVRAADAFASRKIHLDDAYDT